MPLTPSLSPAGRGEGEGVTFMKCTSETRYYEAFSKLLEEIGLMWVIGLQRIQMQASIMLAIIGQW
jgi:hypothetical protein